MNEAKTPQQKYRAKQYRDIYLQKLKEENRSSKWDVLAIIGLGLFCSAGVVVVLFLSAKGILQ